MKSSLSKRILAMILCIVTCLSLLPTPVFADAEEGSEDEEVVWNDRDSELDLVHESERLLLSEGDSGSGGPENAAGPAEGTEVFVPEEEGRDALEEEGEPSQLQSGDEPGQSEGDDPDQECAHTYSYVCTQTGHFRHVKVGTCTKCGATLSVEEEHSWSADRCALCSCPKPLTEDGAYEVIVLNGVQLYAQADLDSTKLQLAEQGTVIAVTDVAAADDGYYWGKVTTLGTEELSSEAWVRMNATELQKHQSGEEPAVSEEGEEQDDPETSGSGSPGIRKAKGAAAVTASCSHSYTYTYTAAGHSQHTKKGTCSKCGATTSTKENHTWSGSKCSLCGCYKPITSNGTYDVTATNGVQLYSENNSGSTKVKVVSKGTSITVTNVAAASSGYYWGKVTKVGTTTQSTTAWVCMKSSELGTHSHSYTYTYTAAGHSQHTKAGTCSKCGATTSTTENHSWSGSKCSLCGCYKPITANGTYDVTATNGVQLYSENNSGSTKVKVVSKGTSITVTNVAVSSSSGYYWGKVTKVGTTTQSTTAWVCMKSSELGTHSHSYTYTYTAAGHSQHTKAGTCSKCGATTSTTENHSWSGETCSLCGCYKPITANGTYDVIAANGVQLYAENNSGSTKVKVVSKGTSITVTNVAASTSSGYYWGKVTKVGTTTQSTTAWVCMRSSELGTHSHNYSYSYSSTNNVQHTKTGTCTKCGATTSTTENHSFSNMKCTVCGGWQAYSSAGDYVVINDDGVKLYSQRITSGSSQELRSLAKGTFVQVTDVQLNDVNNYWGKVAMIGNETPSQTMYIYMGSGQVQPHSHSFTKTYTEKSDSQHNVISTCSCGYKQTSVASHSWSGGKCSQCGKSETPHTTGGYVTYRDSEALRSDVYQDASCPQSVPKGTFIEISEVRTNSYGNYWGKVSSINGTAPSSTMYAYMGNLNPHSHTLTTVSSNVNNVEHDTTVTCSGCAYTSKTRANHSFSNKKCTVCGGWQAYSSAGDYVVINENGVKLYSKRISDNTSQELKTIKKGTFVQISSVQLNDAKNYWGKVDKIGNETPSQTMYIYMGSGQIEPHNHSFSKTYTEKSDSQHNVISTCSCGYKETTTAAHSFSGGKCSLCGKDETPHTTGGYVTYRDSEALRSDVYQDSDSPKNVPKGTYIEISEIRTNSYGNYWGRVSSINGTAPSTTMYAYMGNLNPHTHTLTTAYSNVNNLEHDATVSCSGCAYTSKTRSSHSFSNMVCTVCGGWQAYSSSGDYVVINSDGIKAYSKRISDSTSQALKTLKKGTFVQVSAVQLNEANNYWGKVDKIGNETPSQTMYIYLGSGQVQPHVHSFTQSYTEKSDSQHNVISTCSCGYKETSVAAHSFSGGKCSQCGKSETPHTAGGYVTYRDSEALRSDVYQDASSPQNVPKGTYIEISEVRTNSYGNYWGKVSSINGTAPSSTMYAYMGNLKAHTHNLSTAYSNVNNVEHDATVTCSGCAYTSKTRSNHSFSNMVCTVCGGWEAYSSAGDYVVINANGVKLYSKRVSDNTSQVLKTIKKGTFVQISEVQLNDANNYWGKVEKIGNETPSQTMYIYLGSGQIQPHVHSYTLSYSEKSDSQHNVISTCSCGYKETAPEAHSWSGGKCSKCGKSETPHTAGGYVTYRDSEALRADTYQDSDSPMNVPKGTFIEISEIKTNSYGNYWGKVSSINGTAPSSTMYAYMGNLNPHAHTLTTIYSNVNNVEHDASVTCSGCAYTSKTRSNHSFSNMRCTVCGGWEAYSANGGYLVINANGVKLYSKRISDSTSQDLRTIKKGTFVQVSEAQLNTAKNYWAKVDKIDNETPSETMYIYLGSGQVQPHTHSFSARYDTHADAWHVEESACTGCAVIQEKQQKDHVFENGVCTLCGHNQVPNTPGAYVAFRASEPLRAADNKDSKQEDQVEKGTYLEISEVVTNNYGNFWGKVTVAGSRTLDKPLYVYMGNVAAHTHSLTQSYVNSNNISHKTISRCSCGYADTTRENHNFVSGKCTLCGAWEPYKNNGTYLVINDSGVYTYTQRLSSGSSKQQRLLPKNTFIEVSGVGLNDADNYWGKVMSINDEPTQVDMYIYMGSGQVSPHVHSMDVSYSSKSDTQHYKNETCTGCGFTTTEPTAEDHSFDGSGKCRYCGKEKVADTAGLYVTFREVETLRLTPYAKGSSAKEKPEAGSCIEVESVITNDYGNRWGVVKFINGEAPAQSPTYVYMGNVTAHTHNWTKTYKSVNNISHDVTQSCSGCNMSRTERLPHAYSGGVCSDCTAWQAYEANGDYITVKDGGVPVYSRDITSADNSRILDSLPKGTYLHVENVHLNSADNYWGRVTRIGNKTITQEMYVYMGRGSLSAHTHTVDTTYASKSDTQHNVNTTCTVCGYTDTEPVAENHTFNASGVCSKCGKAEFTHSNGLYVTVRESEALRESTYADSSATDHCPKGTALEITDIATNKYGNWWGRVVSIDGKQPAKTCYAYIGNLKAHAHSFTETCETINNKTHKTVTVCSGCNMRSEETADHKFGNGTVCEKCGAWKAYTADGGYVTTKEEGVPLYSKNNSDKSKGSTVLKTLPAGTYIEVKGVSLNSANNYWGKVVRIGNYAEKETMYVYMGRGQLQAHGENDHDFDLKYVSSNNVSHKVEGVCKICSYTKSEPEDHRWTDGEHTVCGDCGAWKAYSADGGYLTTKDGVVLYSMRLSDKSKGSKELKTLPVGTYLEIKDVQLNSAGNYWGKVTAVDNTASGKTAMYVYMGSGSLQPHAHRMEFDLISTSDTQHIYGNHCADCAFYVKNPAENHQFENGICIDCGTAEITHVKGQYVTFREKEPLRADSNKDSKEVKSVPAGTRIAVSSVVTNKYGNYWGKVSSISGTSVGKTVLYVYMGNVQAHPDHDLVPYYAEKNDVQHKVGEKCSVCDFVRFTGTEDHCFDSEGICEKCGMKAVPAEKGNYVTLRESEPLREKASKDAKALKNVPAGTRLTIGKVTQNSYSNRWGLVTQIDGVKVSSSKAMYVYMGNVQRHENHDMQLFCEKKSDATHTTGYRCSICNYMDSIEAVKHSFGEDGVCTGCGAKQVAHSDGGYLVEVAGNLKNARKQDGKNVQAVKVGAYLEVTDISQNEYGNWWGRVTAIDGVRPKQKNAFVYLGNLTPHEHTLKETVLPKDNNKHTVISECTECQYRLEADSQHASPVDGKCPRCNTEIPVSTSKGDYETYREVTLYQDEKLTKPAGVTVNENYLIVISSVKSVKDSNGNVTYVGRVSRYGDAPSGKDVLYVRMSEIRPHTNHRFDAYYWSKCDEYHYRSQACSIVGCSKTQKGTEQTHSFENGVCKDCGKAQVPRVGGVYRVSESSDLTLYSKENSSSSTAATAKKGTIIIVDTPRLVTETGNYWGKVTWYNGKKAAKTAYAYMGSLKEYIRSSSVTVCGSDKTSHYLQDGNEVFPEKHDFRNGACTICGMMQNAPVTGLHITTEKTATYTKSAQGRYIKSTKSYSAGSVLRITSIETSGSIWYGVVASCNGVKEKTTRYVQISGLTYHGEHLEGSEHYVQSNDKQHVYDVNCPVCGTNKKVKADHVFDENGVCVLCGALQPYTEKGDCFIAIKALTVYAKDVESSAIVGTLPKGTVLKVDKVVEKNGLYMGTGIHILEDGELKNQKGYIRMSRSFLTVHEHDWSAEKMTAHTETGHTMERACTVCGLKESWEVPHLSRKCDVCGAGIFLTGDYTVKDQTATVYRDKDGKSKYLDLHEGDYVKITKVEPYNGVYWGKVFKIGSKEYKDAAYIPMHCLKTHAHDWQRVLIGTEDNYHIYKATCASCDLTEQILEEHAYNQGKCAVCGKTVVPTTPGMYLAAQTLTVYKDSNTKAAKVKSNATVAKGTHVIISEVRVEGSFIATEEDGSFYGQICWGKIRVAGKVKYSGEAWVRMGSLESDPQHTTVTYKEVNEKLHSLTYECDDSCGLKGSISLAHEFDSAGNCVRCGYMQVKKGTYYTTRPNCKIYRLPANAATTDFLDCCGTITMAGTRVEVKDVKSFSGKQYCYCSVKTVEQTMYTDKVWIDWNDLTDHIHVAVGIYTVVDDEYHKLTSGGTGSVCSVCGEEIPELNTSLTTSKHSDNDKDGYCDLCGMKTVPNSTKLTYYAPYDGYYTYKTTSQFGKRGTSTYKAGEKITIEKVLPIKDGIIWGKVKGTSEYVMMRTLSTTSVSRAADIPVLTDEEVINWCMNSWGITSFHTYMYHTEMINTIGTMDILLMGINNRASGVMDQIYQWIKQSQGETLAKKYYRGQVVSLLSALEEEAKYSVSLPYMKEVKNVLKVAKTGLDIDLAANKKLKKCDIDAIKKLKSNIGSVGDYMSKGEIALDLYAYIVTDFGRMEGIIETARAIQQQSTNDPDLMRAFEEVILSYEGEYYLRSMDIMDMALKKVIGDAEKEIIEIAASTIKDITGFDVATGWSDWSFVYSVVNFALDMGMQISGGAKYSKCMMKFMSQISVMSAADNAYSAAVNRVRDGDHSAAAVTAVRRQFAAYKVSVVQLYDAMIDMASNHLFGIAEDNTLINYLQFERDKIDSIYLTDDNSLYVEGISFEEYKRMH